MVAVTQSVAAVILYDLIGVLAAACACRRAAVCEGSVWGGKGRGGAGARITYLSNVAVS